MELISTDDYFILQHLQRSETSLWVCRKTGQFSVRAPWDLADQENPECLGLVWGIYGKLDIHPEVCQRLVLVKGKPTSKKIHSIPITGTHFLSFYESLQINKQLLRLSAILSKSKNM